MSGLNPDGLGISRTLNDVTADSVTTTTTTTEEIDAGTLISSLQAAGYDITGLDELDAASINTDSASVTNNLTAGSVNTNESSVGTVEGFGDTASLIDRRTPTDNPSTIQFTGLSNKEYTIHYYSVQDTKIYARMNGDGASTGSYSYRDISASRLGGQNEFLLFNLGNRIDVSGSLTVRPLRLDQTDPRTGFVHRPMYKDFGRVNNLATDGGRAASGAISSIELISDGGWDSGVVVELWEREIK